MCVICVCVCVSVCGVSELGLPNFPYTKKLFIVHSNIAPKLWDYKTIEAENRRDKVAHNPRITLLVL